MSDKNLLIMGAGGHGKVIADIAVKTGEWRQIAFLDDDESITSSMGIAVIGKGTEIEQYIDEYDVFVALGNNEARKKYQDFLENAGARVPVMIHPNAVIGTQVEIGAGTAIMAGAVINCCSTIGKGCIINTGATVDHDNVLEDHVHISPGAHLAGNVHIGKGTWVGIGATVGNNIHITGGCIIGAGAVVIKDIDQPGTYIGMPARKIN